jgi:sigma-B regulation protein RsbU (phosphoserine phosphatase)
VKEEKLKILVVDDDPNFKLFLLKTLEEWGHEVITADDGLEALDIMKKKPIRLIISDWMMPEMDGVQLCKNIRSWKDGDYIYFIMVTTKSAQPDLITGREAGADDFLSKSFDTDELKVCLRTGIRILNLQNELKEKNENLSIAYKNVNESYKIIEEDLRAASRIQKLLLPPPGKIRKTNFQWFFKPAGFVAGDTFNYFPVDEENIAFYMIDVSGHGVPSALLSVTLQQLLSPSSEQGTDAKYKRETLLNPVEVMNGLNQRFRMKGEDHQYFTMVYGVVNQKEETLKFSLAGHPLPIVQNLSGVNAVGGFSTPIGWIPDGEYQEYKVALKSGSRVFIHSDGITDCLLSQNEKIGSLEFILEDYRKRPLENLIEFFKIKSANLEKCGTIEDDISLLALEIN